MTRRNKPTKQDFKAFWSVFEAKQARKKQQQLDRQSQQEQDHQT